MTKKAKGTSRLESVDLSAKLSKEAYKKKMGRLEIRLGELQREARSLGIPVAIVFEGWDAAGKGTLINRLILALDPRGFTVTPTNAPNEEERLRPFLWKFWRHTPGRGRIAIFDRSWYGRVLVERVDKLASKREWTRAYEEIVSFERQLTDDGCVLLKFFLHIGKAEQKRRFKKLMKNEATAWKVTEEDWRHHRQYGSYARAVEEMLERTDRERARWTPIGAEDERHAVVKLFETAVRELGARVAGAKREGARKPRAVRLPPFKGGALEAADLEAALTRKAYGEELKDCQRRLREIEHEIYRKRIPLIVLYEGWDAAGKGGNIRRLVANMDPRGYEVIPIAAPNDVEKSHHYLWRFWVNLPKAGHIAIFDRTWYGRVLVERIEGFCAEAEWKRAYGEINEMEAQLTGFGAVLVKFWLHIGEDEQLGRFKAREVTAHKQWKITEEDWRNREKWTAYRDAVDEMLARTSPPNAPWTVVEANCKWHARIKCMKTVIEAADRAIRQA